MSKEYQIIFNKNGSSLTVKADVVTIENDIIRFKRIIDDSPILYNGLGEIHNDCLESVALFNMDNIIGFKMI